MYFKGNFSSFLSYSFCIVGKLLFLLFLSHSLLAQEKTTEFKELEIRESYRKMGKELTIDRSEMERLAPHDLGHLLQYTNGVALKDYGGLGGMKTLAMRGLGGQHTRLVINGLPTSNAQNGQTDFGLVQVDNLEKLTVNQGVSKQLLPVGALALGNMIVLQTFENTFSAKDVEIRAVTAAGSFGQRDIYAGVKAAKNNKFLAVSGKYRQFEGDYPYQFKMGNASFQGLRRNNSFNEHFVTIGGGWKSKSNRGKGHHKATFITQLDASDKALPGAVIMYNNLADESLRTENMRAGGKYQYYSDQLQLMSFASYNRGFLHYHDSSFLNHQGYLDNQFTNHSLNAGTTVNFELGDLAFSGGTEITFDDLESNIELGHPERFSANNMLGLHFKNDYFETNVFGFSQYYQDYNRSQFHADQVHRLNPQISLSTGNSMSENLVFHAWYKQTLRPPSFNELYYSQIGNISLAPEDAQQINIGVVWSRSWKNYSLGLSSNAYYNLIDNKILSLPTKNLFVWAILNVGKVETKGIDIHINQSLNINENWDLSLAANATYQKVVDITEENSPTYHHQLAYTPRFTGNVTGSLYFKKWSMHHTIFGLGERFSLSQNIPANQLDPFALWDVSMEYKMKLKEKHIIRVQAGVRNVTDKHYNFIRFFVMPGRNYFIKLMYEI
jgi:outer membrane cobalamin receptor